MIPKDLLIFGAGTHARKLAKALQSEGSRVHAFLSSRPTPSGEVDGIPSHTFASLPKELRSIGPIACGVFNREDAYQVLADLLSVNGFDQICWPWDYYPGLHQRLGWCYWLDEDPRDLQSWRQDSGYQEVMALLADDESRSVIERIIAFRSGSDLAFSAFKSEEQQYFNHLTLHALPKDRPIRYLDLGAYNGDTLEHLCTKALVGTAILLEPDPSNFRELVVNSSRLVARYPDLQPHILPLGAGSEFGFIRLEAGGEASSLHSRNHSHSEDSYWVTVTPLDDVLPVEHVDFVKIDVEGHDREALLGMKGILNRSTPVVAVSLYHRPRDFVDLTLQLKNTLHHLPYMYYVRQHLYNSFETVLYAVPAHG